MAALAGVVVVGAYGALVKATGVPMRADFLAAAHAPAGSVVTGVRVCTFWETVLPVVLSRLSVPPRRALLFASCTLAALSLVVPVGARATTVSTKVTFATFQRERSG